MRTQAIVLMAAIAGLALAGCQRQADNGPTELSGRLFVFNYRVASASYMITLKKIAPIPEGTTAVAEFENPMGGDPLVVREKIYTFWDKITLESPDLRCVRKDRPYSVSIKLVDASDKTIQIIKTEVKSDLDQTVLPTRPLVVGPSYTKNPDVFKADGSIDYGHDQACPA
ncbi:MULTISPECIES: hypothetical protein [unclassified Rhizobium]|uniref:hypothetical protein n=1 Tax=unclassified Rhizobium TaxID=2613769 RepID=UPI000CDF549E|nr:MULTISPECIES: hypothetical protein [Rhizobium]AVA20994.1 hypothetical protein NXC24_CH01330 [Rhizobium sp. NXC24]MDK4739137.1 hypothetical protein [Rhizobium sp. CNPSo 3464]UWU22195.1 hypothetical protein N2601_04235 [Rhizobium tropici]